MALGWVLAAASSAAARSDAAPTEVVRVGLYQNAPKVFDDDGTARGFFPEVLGAVLDALDLEPRYHRCEWAECLDALERGRIDLMPDVALTEDRAARFGFGQEAWLHASSVFYHRLDRRLRKIDDLAGHRIALVDESVQEQAILSLERERGWTVEIVKVPDMASVLSAVGEGRADFGVVNLYFGRMHADPTEVVESGVILAAVPLHVAYRPGFPPALVRRIDALLAWQKIEPDSAYHRAYRRWLWADPGTPDWAFLALGGLFGAVLLAVTAALVFHRRERGTSAALLRSRDRVAAVAESVGLGIWEWDPASDQVAWDQSMYRLYGLQPGADEVVTVAAWMERIHPDDRVRLARQLARTRDEQTPLEVDLRILHADGSELTVKSQGRFVRAGSTMVGIQLDITEWRRLERRLREAERMEALGKLTGGIAHDFNNRLLVITTNLELALEDLSDPELPELISDALEAARGSAELTRRLLAFSRRQDLRPRRLDLNQILARMREVLGRALPGSVTLVCEPHSEPLWVDVDAAQLESTVVNIARNALDAMPDGGRLTLSCSRKCVPSRSGGPEVVLHRLVVTDDGEGMDEEVRRRAFEPFFTTRPIGSGTGVGLSAAHGFAVQSGGSVELTSAPGQGTQVILSFPAADAPAAVEINQPASQGATTPPIQADSTTPAPGIPGRD